MARTNYNLLFKKADEFWKLAQQGVDDPNEQDDQGEESPEEEEERLREELARAQERRRAKERSQRRQQPQYNQRPQRGQAPAGQPQQRQQRPTAQPQAQQQSADDVILNGLKQEVYSGITPAGQALKGTFTGDIFTQITNIFNKELFYHATIGRGDRDQMRKYVATNRVRLGVTVTINTNSDSSVAVRFWATDKSFRTSYPNQTNLVEQQLNQVLKNIIANNVQSTIQTNGLTEPPLQSPLTINSWFTVSDNNGDVAYTQV